MALKRQRRSPRLVIRIPIRVFGTDYRGMDFVEDTQTLVVNLHGARIPLERQLVPDQEIVIQSLTTDIDAVFRVVGADSAGDPAAVAWGVECLNPEENVWGIEFPAMSPEDHTKVRLDVECPQCRRRETLFMNERTATELVSSEGLERECAACGKVALWKPTAALHPA